MRQEPHRRPAPLRGAAALKRRENLFTITLVASVLLAVAGFGAAIVHWVGDFPTVPVFGHTVALHPTPVSWVLAVYSFVLAFRTIWLPDHRLRIAKRNLILLVVAPLLAGALTVAIRELVGHPFFKR